MVRTIDIHNHLYPQVWMDYLEKRTSSPRMKRTGPTSAIFLWEDDMVATIRFPGHYDPRPRIADLDRCGIDTQILSLSIPPVDLLPLDEGITWSKKINDYYAEVCHKYPGRFYAYATLPYLDVAEALKELDRAYRELGVKGISMFSHVNGKPIHSPEFHPIYAKAEEYGLPIFIHPAIPLTFEIMKQYKATAGIYGYPLDTTLAVMGLIFEMVLEKFPKLNIIHPHLGGVVPYLVWRMEKAWQHHFDTSLLPSSDRLPKTPSEYYKQQVYADSVSSYLPAMRCCLDFVGPRHLCLGTDYAHGPADWNNAISIVREMNLSEEDTDDILGGNAARIFKLE